MGQWRGWFAPQGLVPKSGPEVIPFAIFSAFPKMVLPPSFAKCDNRLLAKSRKEAGNGFGFLQTQ